MDLVNGHNALGLAYDQCYVTLFITHGRDRATDMTQASKLTGKVFYSKTKDHLQKAIHFFHYRIMIETQNVKNVRYYHNKHGP